MTLSGDNGNKWVNYTRDNFLIAELALAVFVSFFDVFSGEIRGISSILMTRSLVMLIGAVLVFVALLCTVVWFALLRPLGRIFGLDLFRLLVAQVIFVAVVYFFYSVHREIKFGTFPDGLRIPLIFLGGILVSGLCAIISYRCLELIVKSPKSVERMLRIFLSIAILLSVVVIGYFTNKYYVTSLLSFRSFLVNTVFAVLGLAILIFLFFAKIRTLSRALVSFVLIITCSFCAVLLLEQFKVPLTHPNLHNDHKIKRVILISIDTLRADALGCYNHAKDSLTPNIDEFASESTVFQNAFVCSSWTLPSIASMFTGLPVAVHMAREKDSRLPDSIPTITDFLAEQGYLTCAIVNNTFLSPRANLAKGFAQSHFYPKAHKRKNLLGHNILKYIGPRKPQYDISTEEITELAKNWLSRNVEHDFFLWVHYFDPHAPYAPPVRYIPEQKPPIRIGNSFDKVPTIRSGHFFPTLSERQWIRELYNGEVRYVDENVGELLSYLKKLNIYEDSLIILTSDHGEEFWEHGNCGHGHSQYNELLSVPLIIKLTGNNKQRVIKKPVSMESLAPTILRQCNISLENKHFTSLPLEIGENRVEIGENKPIISEGKLYYEDRIAIIFDNFRYKYIKGLITDTHELYDLSNDQGELINLVEIETTKVKQANDLLEQHKSIAKDIKQQLGLKNGSRKELDQETIEKLKSLGYIQ